MERREKGKDIQLTHTQTMKSMEREKKNRMVSSAKRRNHVTVFHLGKRESLTLVQSEI